jgi:hypothetical protein
MSIETSQASKPSTPTIATRQILPEKPDCGICFETGQKYVAATKNGHIFCLPCLNQWMEEGRNKTRPSDCPGCHEPLKNVKAYKLINGSWVFQGKMPSPPFRQSAGQQHHTHPAQQSEEARLAGLRSAYGSPAERESGILISSPYRSSQEIRRETSVFAAELRSLRIESTQPEDAETNRNSSIGLGIITTITFGALALGSMLFKK